MIARYALFLVAIGFSLGALSRSLFVYDVVALGFVAILVTIFIIAWAITRFNAYAFATILLISALAGSGRAVLAIESLPSTFAPLVGSEVSFEGRVATEPDIRETSQRITVRVENTGEVTRLLAVVPSYPQVAYGEYVRVSGRLELPEPFDTENGREFRYDRHLAKDGVLLIMPRASIESFAPPSAWDAYTFGLLYQLKAVFMDGVEAALPEPSAALAEGILVGGKQGLGKELLDVFTIAGLVHVVVLSGYNIMLVARGFLTVFGKGRRTGQVAAGVAILLFVLMAGAGSASIRAGLMAGLALFARATGRTYDALRALAAVTLLMLLHNPLLLAYDIGFQFTLAATIGVIWLTPLIERRLATLKPGFIREIAATTLAAQIGILPILLYQTGILSPYALPANLIVLSLIPPAMLFSFVAGIAGMLVPAVAPIIAFPAHVLLMVVVSIAEGVSKLPGATATVPAFGIWVVVFAYAVLIALSISLQRGERRGSFKN